MKLHRLFGTRIAHWSLGCWGLGLILCLAPLGCAKDTDSDSSMLAEGHDDPSADESAMTDEDEQAADEQADSNPADDETPAAPPPPSMDDEPAETDDDSPAVEPMPTTPIAAEPPEPDELPDAGEPVEAGVSEEMSDAGDEEDEEEGWELDSMDDPIENPATCPTDEPTMGEGCPAYNLVCKYGDTPDCRSRWICSSNETWFQEFGMRDCPSICPESEPSEGDACSSNNAQCTYGDNPTCVSQWHCYEGSWALVFPARDCVEDNNCPAEPPRAGFECDPIVMGAGCSYETGIHCGCQCTWDDAAMASGMPTTAWGCRTIEAAYPPDYLRACPQEMPEPGTPCDTSSGCGYVEGDICESPDVEVTVARCEDGAWVLGPDAPIGP